MGGLTHRLTEGEARGAGCSGKSGFASWRVARRALKRMLRRGERGLTMYRCRFCRGWHVGTKNAGDRK